MTNISLSIHNNVRVYVWPGFFVRVYFVILDTGFRLGFWSFYPRFFCERWKPTLFLGETKGARMYLNSFISLSVFECSYSITIHESMNYCIMPGLWQFFYNRWLITLDFVSFDRYPHHAFASVLYFFPLITDICGCLDLFIRFDAVFCLHVRGLNVYYVDYRLVCLKVHSTVVVFIFSRIMGVKIIFFKT